MQTYKCHKTVKAAQINSITRFQSAETNRFMFKLFLDDGHHEIIQGDSPMFARGIPASGDYLISYEDGYLSFSPCKAFEDGYRLIDPSVPAPRQVLMSPENPDGWKLEELFQQLMSEIRAKCAKIAGQTETDATALVVYQNNLNIISCLANAEAVQRQSYHALHANKGKNNGPLGKPRIGIGADAAAE